MADILIEDSGDFLEATKSLLSNLQAAENPDERNTTKYSFILTAAATLECLLNRAIVGITDRDLNQSTRKRHAEALLSMSLRGKLDSLGYLASRGEFITANESWCYKSLSNLISMRNKITHKKEYFSVFTENTFSDIRRKDYMSPLNDFVMLHEEIYESLEVLNEFIENEFDQWHNDLFENV